MRDRDWFQFFKANQAKVKGLIPYNTMVQSIRRPVYPSSKVPKGWLVVSDNTMAMWALVVLARKRGSGNWEWPQTMPDEWREVFQQPWHVLVFVAALCNSRQARGALVAYKGYLCQDSMSNAPLQIIGVMRRGREKGPGAVVDRVGPRKWLIYH